jgi:small-conductance mechanosensitive channel
MIRRFKDIQVNVRDAWEKLLTWMRIRKGSRFESYAEIDDDSGLISSEYESRGDAQSVIVKKADKSAQLDRLQEGFNQLVAQLEHINQNLTDNLTQQKDLVAKMAQMPRMMEHFPLAIENQQRTIELLNEQFKATSEKTAEFMDVLKKLPEESMRQTDTLISINRQLSVAADTDIIMNENFNKFNLTLEKLNQATMSQTDSVVQMSKTFEASDRYLKHLVAKQNKRFMWVFFVAVGVCVAAILSLITIIVFIK